MKYITIILIIIMGCSKSPIEPSINECQERKDSYTNFYFVDSYPIDITYFCFELLYNDFDSCRITASWDEDMGNNIYESHLMFDTLIIDKIYYNFNDDLLYNIVCKGYICDKIYLKEYTMWF